MLGANTLSGERSKGTMNRNKLLHKMVGLAWTNILVGFGAPPPAPPTLKAKTSSLPPDAVKGESLALFGAPTTLGGVVIERICRISKV